MGSRCDKDSTLLMLYTKQFDFEYRCDVNSRFQKGYTAMSNYFRLILRSPILESACWPVKIVTTARIPPYSRTCPSFKSIQYHTSKLSKAPRVTVNGRMLGENRCVTRGEIWDHCQIISELSCIKRATTRTKPSKTSQGARTTTEKMAEMGRGGSFCSGRNV
jgi:hypothetical protein